MIHGLKLGSIGDFAIRKVFKKLDKNKNGELDASEVASAVDIVRKLVSKALSSGGGDHTS